ncbi:glutamate--tRNA ligase [archaeon]|nr:MAG: glutamate--tRNA ligase [archaeon]
MDENILRHALANALDHDGKANGGSVIGSVLAQNPELKKDIKSLVKQVNEIVKYVNGLSTEEQRLRLEEFGMPVKPKETEEVGLPGLVNAEDGKVVMRLAPFPSGPLHIGNARMVLLNDMYVKRYHGKLVLVFDDTIGSVEKTILPEAYDLIKAGLDWLGVKYDEVVYKSDRLPIFYENATHMIEKGMLYVCTCSEKKLRDNREKGIECKERSQPVDENLEMWNKMLGGKIKKGGAVVRLRTDMQYPNPAFRDRVMLRISDREHPRVGKKYKVWPTLEFSWAVDDHLLGITHVLRGKQLVIEDMVEEFIWDKMGWNKPMFVHYGMLKIAEGKLSKSETRKMIAQKKISGWDDPRTWTLQSLRARGIQPDAIRKFIEAMGLSEADVEIPVDILYAENRRIVDPISNRYFAVAHPTKIVIDDMPPTKSIQAPLHPDFGDIGNRTIPLSKNIYIDKNDTKLFNKSVGMINLFTVVLKKRAKYVSAKISYDDPKIHWVSDPNVEIKLLMNDGKILNALAEPDVSKINNGAMVQFYRMGFFKIEKSKKGIVAHFSHK